MSALEIWQEKLEFLKQELASSPGGDHKFSILASIKEARARIVEFGGTLDGPAEPAQQVAPEPNSPESYSGAIRNQFEQRLSNDWRGLATILEIKDHERATWPQGLEAGEIWKYLEARQRLGELPGALKEIGRIDLAKEFPQ